MARNLVEQDCKNCRWSKPHSYTRTYHGSHWMTGNVSQTVNHKTLRCHKRASVKDGFPHVQDSDFCGEWEYPRLERSIGQLEVDLRNKTSVNKRLEGKIKALREEVKSLQSENDADLPLDRD